MHRAGQISKPASTADGNVGIEGLAVDLRQRLLIKGFHQRLSR